MPLNDKAYYRGYIPHLNLANRTQHVTFRLADSYPQAFLERVRASLEARGEPKRKRDFLQRKAAQEMLDKGYGSCVLRKPEVGKIVEEALLFKDQERYQLHAWCVMPNHCHVLVTPFDTYSLDQILHSWKSFSANQANKICGSRGRFWARGNFDRLIRDQEHFHLAVAYINENPVKAGLCERAENWPFGSARLGLAGF